MDWEALGFYQKLGYKVEFQRDGYEHHSTLFFLIKSAIDKNAGVKFVRTS